MNKLIFAGIGVIALGGMAMAAGTHSGGHGHNDSEEQGHNDSQMNGHNNSDDHHAMMAIGQPGNAAGIDREIEIIMSETDDGDMIFEPSNIEVHKGETIRFVLVNAGEMEHEFVLDDHPGVMEHKALMEKFPEMEHDDPNSVRLESGHRGEVLWNFTNTGGFEFACLIPGHFDAGMRGDLTVSDKAASN